MKTNRPCDRGQEILQVSPLNYKLNLLALMEVVCLLPQADSAQALNPITFCFLGIWLQ